MLHQLTNTAKAAPLQRPTYKLRAALVPRPCLTLAFPTDQFSVGGDYVRILALATKICLTNKNEKPLRFGNLMIASLGLRRVFVSFSGTGRLFAAAPARRTPYRIGAFLIASRRLDVFLRH